MIAANSMCASAGLGHCEAGVVFYFSVKSLVGAQARTFCTTCHKFSSFVCSGSCVDVGVFGKDLVGRGFCVEFIDSSGAEVLASASRGFGCCLNFLF